jgi:hypothetical protein
MGLSVLTVRENQVGICASKSITVAKLYDRLVPRDLDGLDFSEF